MSIIQQQPASKPGDKQHWGELRAAGRALAVAEAALDYSGLTMLVTETARQAAEQTRALQFFTAEQQLPIYSFPDWETLPYDIFSPHQDIISQRLQTLANLPSARQGIIVVPLSTLMHRIAPTDFVASHSFSYTIGEELDRTQLQDQLGRAGYRRVDTVFEHGEFAFRGSIIDIYPMGEKNPFRIDLLDDEIESLRRFDPESQRTTETVNQLLLLPAREFPTDSEATNRFLNNWHDHFDHDPGQCSIYNDIKDGIAPQGIEYYLPLFFEQTATLFDYLPNDVQLFTHAGIEEAAATFWQDINSRHEEYGVDPERPILPPGEIFVPTEILFQHIKQLARTIISHQQVEERAGQSNLQLHAVPEVAVNAKLTNPLNNLQVFIEGIGAEVKILFCAESAGRREVLTELLKGIDIKPTEVDHWQQFVTGDHSYCITTYPIDQGVYCPAQQICLITEGELFGQQVMQRRRRSKASESPDYVFKNLAELKVGSPVVHIEHGVGRYQGLITLEVDRAIQEFLMLSYADDAKLYVPVSSLHLDKENFVKTSLPC